MKDFDVSGLSVEQLRVANIVLRLLGKDADGGGCKAFYTPDAWRQRGERWGTESVLVLVHDGGDLAPFCNHDYMEYERISQLDSALREKGFYIEQCTSWYSAVYRCEEHTSF